jgi:1-acyl-sn-glycerol-3-phosphate acyltransferase
MPTPLFPPPKPVANIWRPELTRLPRLNQARVFFRTSARLAARILIRLLTEATLLGLEHFPIHGPAVIVVNHLGDADTAFLLGFLPVLPEALGKVELYEFPILGKLMDWYGIIWLHRGRPDRRALGCAIDGLAEGRFIVIAPEGRYSLNHGLEEGGPGAAYLALKANVPIVPIALTGTENSAVYGNLRHLKRPKITLTVGQPFYLRTDGEEVQNSLQSGTQRIMESLAQLLPIEYRGYYK